MANNPRHAEMSIFNQTKLGWHSQQTHSGHQGGSSATKAALQASEYSQDSVHFAEVLLSHWPKLETSLLLGIPQLLPHSSLLLFHQAQWPRHITFFSTSHWRVCVCVCVSVCLCVCVCVYTHLHAIYHSANFICHGEINMKRASEFLSEQKT